MPDPSAILSDAAGKTAFVAGAAGGIGRAIVACFRAAGVRVAAGDTAKLDKRADDYAPFPMDATDERQVIAAIGSAADRFGPIDFVVNAVGKAGAGPLHEVAAADWRDIVEVNLTSAFVIAKQAYTRLRKPGGVLILIGSTNGRTGGTPFSGPAYGAAKAGVINLTRYLAREWAGEGVRVNCLAPGPVDTPMVHRLSDEVQEQIRAGIPLGRIATAEEIAGAVAYLCSPHAASMTGAVLNISGGLVLD